MLQAELRISWVLRTAFAAERDFVFVFHCYREKYNYLMLQCLLMKSLMA